mmetsp:Transcript_6731/g.13232  ORF Transcript_6731/g.13232 Transcript_6731/m.13232 type:complete len:136 (-) Transcript_6731:349-756(-)
MQLPYLVSPRPRPAGCSSTASAQAVEGLQAAPPAVQTAEKEVAAEKEATAVVLEMEAVVEMAAMAAEELAAAVEVEVGRAVQEADSGAELQEAEATAVETLAVAARLAEVGMGKDSEAAEAMVDTMAAVPLAVAI